MLVSHRSCLGSGAGERLVNGAPTDKLPMLRDGSTGDWIGTFQGHKGAVWSAKLNVGATQAATGSADFSARRWDALTGDELAVYPHRHIVKSVDFSDDGRRLYTGGRDKSLRVFDVRGGAEEVQAWEMPSSIRKVVHLPGSPSLVVVGRDDGALVKVDTRNGESQEVARFDGPVKDIEVSRDGALLSVAAGREASFFRLRDLSLVRAVAVEGLDEVDTVTLHPTKGHRFVAVRLLCPRDCHVCAACLLQKQAWDELRALSSQAGGEDNLLVYECDATSGETFRVLRGHHGPVRCLRYSPDAERFASGSEDGTIRLWYSGEDLFDKE